MERIVSYARNTIAYGHIVKALTTFESTGSNTYYAVRDNDTFNIIKS